MADDTLRVLVVDDDPLQLDLVERTLKAEGFEVMTCENPIGVTNIVRSFLPHVVLMDVDIPALSGDKILSIARKSAPPMTQGTPIATWPSALAVMQPSAKAVCPAVPHHA